MMATDRDTYDRELEQRLAEVTLPENQGQRLTSNDFLYLSMLTVILPIIALVGGWFL